MRSAKEYTAGNGDSSDYRLVERKVEDYLRIIYMQKQLTFKAQVHIGDEESQEKYIHRNVKIVD